MTPATADGLYRGHNLASMYSGNQLPVVCSYCICTLDLGSYYAHKAVHLKLLNDQSFNRVFPKTWKRQDLSLLPASCSVGLCVCKCIVGKRHKRDSTGVITTSPPPRPPQPLNQARTSNTFRRLQPSTLTSLCASYSCKCIKDVSTITIRITITVRAYLNPATKVDCQLHSFLPFRQSISCRLTKRSERTICSIT
jgi:hypothetical protein